MVSVFQSLTSHYARKINESALEGKVKLSIIETIETIPSPGRYVKNVKWLILLRIFPGHPIH